MKSLYELAQFYSDQAYKSGTLICPQAALHTAATKAVEGYSDLDEAESEDGIRYDAWGNEIRPELVRESVHYIKALPAWITSQFRTVALRLDDEAAEKITHLPDDARFDKIADRLESSVIAKKETLDQAAALFANHYSHDRT